ncbi:hypothetical protein [Rhodococcus sp. 077-4]|uniref:hypothetical protein n=1 Tax=Rhodococcus sp. 077-4 TaxID=2789271 RepID=UPI0039F45842
MAVSNPADDQWFAPLPAEHATPTPQRPAVSTPPLDTTGPRAYSDLDPSPDSGARVLTLPASTHAVPPWQAVLDAAPRTSQQSAPSPAAARGTDTPARESSESWLRRNRAALAVTGSLAALAALATAGVLVLTGPDEAPDPVAAPQHLEQPEATALTTTAAATTTPKVLTAAEWCAQQTGGQHAAADSPDPELAVIGRIEDAYYRSRDIAAVNAQLAPGVTVKPDDFAAAIAAIPAGTDHCVLTTPLGPSQYRVTVIERRPGGEQKRFASAMTTQRTPDGTNAVITAIGRAPE